MTRFHAWLTHLLPHRFRRRYDAEMGDMLRARHAEVAGSPWLRRTTFWLRELIDLSVTIAREWLRLLYGSPHGPAADRSATTRSLPERGTEMLFNILGDARYALRTLARQPLFSLSVVATVALGVGATTAVYTLVDSVLLRPLPFDEPDRLVVGFGSFPLADSASVSPPDYLDYRDQSTSFEGLAAYSTQMQSVPVGDSGSTEVARMRRASHQLFDVLRVTPSQGRAFQANEAADGAPPVVMISDGFWRRRFGADPEVIGSELLVDEIPTTIVGVLPAEFDFFNAPDLWQPLPFGADNMTVRRFHFLRVLGRLGDGTRLAAAQQEIDTIAGGLADAYPESNTDWTMRLVPLHEVTVGNVRQPLLFLLGAVGAVLLIVCGNVAVLLLARATRRAPELAVRNALGASSGRVARLLLTESLLLAFAGGGLGIGVAVVAVELLIAMSSMALPRAAAITVDASVLLFALAVTAGTGLVFGLAPAIRAARRDAGSALREQGRVAGGRQTLRHALVVGQVALSFALLVGAGLLIRSLDSMTRVEPGFTTEKLTAASIRLPAGRYEEPAQRRLFFEELLAKLQGAASITAAGAVDIAPLSGNGNDTFAYPEGEPPATGTQGFNAQVRSASPAYFDTLQIPLMRGRVFTERDTVGGPPVVILDEPFAAEIFPDGDALGQRIVIDVGEPLVAEVVGVVGGVLHFGAAVGEFGTMYFPTGQRDGSAMTVLVRARDDNRAAVEALRRAVAEIDPLVPLDGTAAVDEWLAASVAGPRFRARLMAIFAIAALALAGGGLYGVLAYFVAERRREIGLRLALGADAGGVMRLIVRRGLFLVGIGLVIGVLAAAALSWSIQGLLFGVSAADPVAFGGVAAVLAGVALLACVLPARRAIRIDPLESLRAD